MSSYRTTLWLRVGVDGARVSGDPSAHHIFMLLLLKSANDERLRFDVKTVNESKPPPEFREAGLRHAPALQISEDEAFSHEDEILDELESYEPKKRACEDAENATADVFRTFAFFIKDKEKDGKAFSTELSRIDSYLSSVETKFLTGDEPNWLDCLVLPRLHSFKIAAKALKDYDFPSDLQFLSKYMKHGYELKIFTTSCPCDQEIVLHWADRPGAVPMAASQRTKISRQTPTFTFDT